MMSEILKRDMGLLTDFYELLMMEGYFDLAKRNKSEEKIVTFDVFYRKNPFGNGFSERRSPINRLSLMVPSKIGGVCPSMTTSRRN